MRRALILILWLITLTVCAIVSAIFFRFWFPTWDFVYTALAVELHLGLSLLGALWQQRRRAREEDRLGKLPSGPT